MFIIDLFYFFMTILIIPFSPKYIFNKEYRKLIKNRLNTKDMPFLKGKRLWLHAVSVGEVKSIKKLIDELDNINDTEVVLSVSTPTGYKIAKQEYSSIKVIMAPLDFSFIIKRFIKKIKPDILILNELELWPNWISLMSKNKIPILLINGRISETAMTKYRKFKFILKFFFKKIDMFLLQSEIYKTRFLDLGVDEKKIKICGNIKADEAVHLAKNISNESDIIKELKIIKRNKKIITLASTHIKDEQLLIPLIANLYEKHSFILVPRHPDRLESICNAMDSENIRYEIWTKVKEVNLKNKVLIFDKIGYLFNIQCISDIIIMGGTYDKKIGGHNLFEPAVLGKNTIGGPYYNNFPDIGDELKTNGIYKIAKSTEDIQNIINKIFNNNTAVKEKAIEIINKRKGSIECIIKEIKQIVN